MVTAGTRNSEQFFSCGLIWIADPAGNVALKVDSRTEFNKYDADTVESPERPCDAQVRYEKDGRGKLSAVVADTACIEDRVRKPSESVRCVWDAPAGRVKGANLPNVREAAGRPIIVYIQSGADAHIDLCGLPLKA
jgi:hypothetical protein